MLHLTCGTPGSGKSLWTISTVEERRKKESREVYYSGIEGLSLDWIELEDATKWDELPKGSIIVIDECQRIFPIRKQSSEVPKHVSGFETHRHKGYDIYLITQSPQLIDMHVRKLVGEYRFLDRPYNQNYVVVHKFRHVVDWKNYTERASAEKTRWQYPKEAFKWYKSAEVHTHKKQFPKFLLWIPALLILLCFCGYLLYGVQKKYTEPKEVKNEPTNTVAVAPGYPSSGQAYFPGIRLPQEEKQREILTTAEYLATWVPRLPELPWSAPAYDELAKPAVLPKVAACVQSGSRCECWTQQATKIDVDQGFCLFYVKNGFFDAFTEAVQQNPTYPSTPETLSARSTASAKPQSDVDLMRLTSTDRQPPI